MLSCNNGGDASLSVTVTKPGSGPAAPSAPGIIRAGPQFHGTLCTLKAVLPDIHRDVVHGPHGKEATTKQEVGNTMSTHLKNSQSFTRLGRFGVNPQSLRPSGSGSRNAVRSSTRTAVTEPAEEKQAAAGGAACVAPPLSWEQASQLLFGDAMTFRLRSGKTFPAGVRHVRAYWRSWNPRPQSLRHLPSLVVASAPSLFLAPWSLTWRMNSYSGARSNQPGLLERVLICSANWQRCLGF